MKKYFVFLIIVFGAVYLLIAGCRKPYYHDTGIPNPNFNGSMMQYFDTKPLQFDTLVKVVKLAGMESYLTDSAITFFAPADASIYATYQYINNRLKSLGRDSLTSLASLKPEFWRNMLKLYMFRGERGLQDFPQLDYKSKQALSGEFVTSINGQVMNIGTVFTDANQIKYQGLRFLTLNYVPSISSPYQGWLAAYVSSSNIKPLKGIIHALMYVDFPQDGSSYYAIPAHVFGFNLEQAWAQANYLGFNP